MEEALARHVSFIYPQGQQDFLQHQVIDPLKANGSHEIEVTMQDRSDRAFCAHLSLSLLRNEVGVPFGMIGYSMDITARKQAEEAMALYIKRLEILHRLDQAILTTQSLSEIAGAALPYIRQLIPACQRASVVLYDFEVNQAVWLASTSGNESNLSQGSRTSLEFFGCIADFTENEYWLVHDIQTMARPTDLDRSLAAAEGVRSYLSMPFFFQNQMIGSLNLGSAGPLPSARKMSR